jgi:predicted ATPase
MIDRLYIHNFRSLENFELPVQGLSSALLIGRNGTGKSSIGFALEILQRIGRGDNRVGKLIRPEDMTRGRTNEPVRFELDVRLSGVLYSYKLALELPQDFRELRVLEESLEVDGVANYKRNVAEIQLPKNGGQESTMSFDWHLVWLSVSQARSDRDPLDVFRKWLARMLILRPYPQGISGDSSDETLNPSAELGNLGDWWTGLISHSPSSYSKIESRLKRMMPDLWDIKNPMIGKDSRSLEIHFDCKGESISLPFQILSDGEKCMVIWAMVMAANEAYGPLFCFWDEPDNYLAISEIGDFAMDLRKAFKNGGQFLATSHNAETIRSFSDENTFVLFRRSHQEPTQIRPLAEIDYSGDLVASLVRGDIEP